MTGEAWGSGRWPWCCSPRASPSCSPRNLFHAVLYLAAALVATGVGVPPPGLALPLRRPAPALRGRRGDDRGVRDHADRAPGGRALTQTSRYVVNGAIVSAAVFVGIVGFLLQAPRAAPAPGRAGRHDRRARPARSSARSRCHARAAGGAPGRRAHRRPLLRPRRRLSRCRFTPISCWRRSCSPSASSACSRAATRSASCSGSS